MQGLSLETREAMSFRGSRDDVSKNIREKVGNQLHPSIKTGLDLYLLGEASDAFKYHREELGELCMCQCHSASVLHVLALHAGLVSTSSHLY
jgi:hypothetical protein